MSRTYLTRHDPDKNMHRFYQTLVTPGIFGDWALMIEWGRIGSPGTVRNVWFTTQEAALQAEQKLCTAKRKKGYQAIPPLSPLTR